MDIDPRWQRLLLASRSDANESVVPPFGLGADLTRRHGERARRRERRAERCAVAAALLAAVFGMASWRAFDETVNASPIAFDAVLLTELPIQ